jgi:hypothetical protein
MVEDVKLKDKPVENQVFSESLNETIYWTQIAFSIFFALFTYYALELRWVDLGFLTDFLLLVIIHLALVSIIALLFLRFKTQASLWTCLKGLFANLGTNLFLFIMIIGVAHLVNI